MTQPEDETQQPGPLAPSEPADSSMTPDAPEPPARMPGAYAPYTPEPSETPTVLTPLPMSTSADHEDTAAWEVPPASATAGAAAASQWAQPAAPPPQPVLPPPPYVAQPTVPQQVVPPPPAQSWQPAPAQPPPQQWQQPQQPAQQWQATPPPPPAQSWQQPAQQWPQQQQQFQQPYAQPYGQPGPYAQPYGQQVAPRPGYNTSPLGAFAGLLLVVFGIATIVLGVFALTQGPDIARFIRDNDIAIFNTQISRDTLRSVLMPSPGVLMFVGLLQFIAGAGVLAHKSWGRWLGFLLALLGLIVAVFAVSIGLAVAGGFTTPVIIGVVLLVGYALMLLALLAGGSHFRRKALQGAQ